MISIGVVTNGLSMSPQWSPLVPTGYQWPPTVPHRHQMVTTDDQWLPLAAVHERFSVVANGPQRYLKATNCQEQLAGHERFPKVPNG